MTNKITENKRSWRKITPKEQEDVTCNRTHTWAHPRQHMKEHAYHTSLPHHPPSPSIQGTELTMYEQACHHVTYTTQHIADKQAYDFLSWQHTADNHCAGGCDMGSTPALIITLILTIVLTFSTSKQVKQRMPPHAIIHCFPCHQGWWQVFSLSS